MHYPLRVLILCTANSARSQMAEGFLRVLGGHDFTVYSAGSIPSTVNPLAIQVMAEHHIDISGHRSKHLNEFLEQEFDFVITVCDNARDTCPLFPGDAERIHWSYPDPAASTGDEEQRLQAFRAVAVTLREQIRPWVATQRQRLSDQGFSIKSVGDKE